MRLASLALVLLAGCWSANAPDASTASTRPAARIDASPVTAGVVAASYQRESGSAATAGRNSPAITYTNSPWPVVATVLGMGTFALLWRWSRKAVHG